MAVQPDRATPSRFTRRFRWIDTPARRSKAARPKLERAAASRPDPQQPCQLIIRGVTRDGKPFRPSDWAERLAGAMSSFRPDGAAGGIGAFIGYSPYCVPRLIDGIKSVIVDEALRGIEPMAWDFVMSFARDNDLVVEAAAASDPAASAARVRPKPTAP